MRTARSRADDVGRRRLSSWRHPGLIAGTAVVVFGATLWLLFGGRGSNGASGTDAVVAGTPVRVDRPAPGFDQPLLLEKGSLNLARFEGKVVVVNFWASWCTACRSEVPELEALSKAYERQGVQFIGVDYEDRRSAAIAFSRDLSMSYPTVLDPNGTIGDAYGIFGLPTTYIISSDRRIRYVVNGRIRASSLRVALESALRTTPSEASGP
jgi:cytochrome c biogenesis protein CcmG/thiol:disulfide interchange protein DsbE